MPWHLRTSHISSVKTTSKSFAKWSFEVVCLSLQAPYIKPAIVY